MDQGQVGNQSSLSMGMNSREVEALKKIRSFSIFAIIGFVLDIFTFAFSMYFLVKVLSSSISQPTPTLTILTMEAPLLASDVVAALLLLTSFFFLRAGFRILKETSNEFASPYTGTTLFFVGLLLVVLGMFIIIAFAFLHSSALVAILVGALVLGAGGIVSLIGEIMALILGSFKLRDHFKKSSYGTAGIMFIVGFFIVLFSLVGAIMVYVTTNTLIKDASGTLQI